jgi:hypothetical protein
MQVRGQFEDVRDLVNVLGRSFCQACMVAFFGRYDPENPALAQVLAARARKKKRRRYYDSEEATRLAEAERRYGDRARRLSHANLRCYPELLNPNGHKVGGSGVSRAYHLDHIVPISTYWEYQVPEVSASDVRNLQVVPWFVNLSRGAGIRLGRETTVPSRKLCVTKVMRAADRSKSTRKSTVDADERSNKERLGTPSFGNDDGMRPKRRPPSGLGGLMEISLALIDGFFDHVDRHFERSRQRADEADTSLEVACAELFKPAQVF